MVFGWLWMIAFWGLLIWGVLALTRTGSSRASHPMPAAEPNALEILERRYARGELSAEEFDQMRQRLSRPRDA